MIVVGSGYWGHSPTSTLQLDPEIRRRRCRKDGFDGYCTGQEAPRGFSHTVDLVLILYLATFVQFADANSSKDLRDNPSAWQLSYSTLEQTQEKLQRSLPINV
jgi:hypothetical protein